MQNGPVSCMTAVSDVAASVKAHAGHNLLIGRASIVSLVSIAIGQEPTTRARHVPWARSLSPKNLQMFSIALQLQLARTLQRQQQFLSFHVLQGRTQTLRGQQAQSLVKTVAQARIPLLVL